MTPDGWNILKIKLPDDTYMYKVFAGFSGGYTDGDFWRANSGIEKVTVEEDSYIFHGYSGSTYRCHKGREGVRPAYAYSVMQTALEEDRVELISYEDYVKEN